MLIDVPKIFEVFFKKRQTFKNKIVNDVPARLSEKMIYLVANDGYIWQAVMLCPCGCKERLFINFLEDQQPYWTYSIDVGKKITLRPSINRRVKCKSHFYIREGKVIWVT